MIVDGKAIAEAIKQEITELLKGYAKPPHLTVFTCAPNFETKKFLALKRKAATELGISVNTIEFDTRTSETEMVHAIRLAVPTTNGIVVQLPFPSHINPEELLMAIPPSHDVDVHLYDGSETEVLPPVVGAIAEISKAHNIDWNGKQVVVVGSGRLVGAPAATWARGQGAQVEVVGSPTNALAGKTKSADILILGTGKPGLITTEMVKDEAIVFDAGTSEAEGVLKGDAAPDVVEKASLVTPVPGGIGPVTIAVLLRNLVRLAGRQ